MVRITLSLIFLLILLTKSTELLSEKEKSIIYTFHDVPNEHDNYGHCEHDMQQQLCPTDEKLPCNSLQKIRKFCEQQIGHELAEKMGKVPKTVVKIVLKAV